jgi:hypothetical protein
MWALILVLIGAAAGSGITWFLSAPDRAQSKKVLETQEKLLQAQQRQVEAQQAAADAQTKIAKLESEREQREFFNQFSPKVTFKLEDHSSENSLALEASEPFIVESIDYLTSSGASVGSQEVGQSSKSIVVPISDECLLKIQRLGPWLSSNDMSATVQFRIHILKDGLRKIHVVPAVLKPVMIGNTLIRQVVG